jgi:Family of unknown function (DUF6101)
VRRQTAKGEANLAGSSRVLRLDPLSLPVSFDAHDVRADNGVRRIELHRERIVLRRAVQGMRMAINLRISDFHGIARRDAAGAQMLVLLHRDPSLTVPLCVSPDADEIAAAWPIWSDLFALPQLTEEEAREPTPRRRRRNAIRARRPKFLVRRRRGGSIKSAKVHRGEREIIARN